MGRIESKPLDRAVAVSKPLPYWERRIAWYLREYRAGHQPPIPWHWNKPARLGRGHQKCCAVCMASAAGDYENVPWCLEHEAMVRAEVESSG
jgi:hypothetical protein